MAVGDRNGAGIRHEGERLVVRDVYMHDGEQGVLAGDGDAVTVLIEDSTFERLGQDGRAHGIYINHIAELVVRRSRFLRSQNEGHELKSRALRTVIECSVLASLDGTDSRTIDLPNGGDVLIDRSVIQQGAASPNRNVLAYGLEGASNPVQRLVITGSVLINDQDRGSFLQLEGGPELSVRDNTFVGPGEVLVGGEPPPGNAYHPDRASAGLPAAPALPEPCP
jgi:hypothetical protein